MTALPDPRNSACAVARVIRARAYSISDLGNQIAAISDPTAVTPEEWVVLSESLRRLGQELNDEIDTFVMRVSNAT